MHPLLIIPHYLAWHYTRGLRDVYTRARDFLWFVWHMFSLPTMVQTFFEPFQRLGVDAPKGFNPERFFEALVTTTVMRIVGMCMRTGVLILGVLSLCSVFCIAVCFAFLWLLIPGIVLALFIGGSIALFANKL